MRELEQVLTEVNEVLTKVDEKQIERVAELITDSTRIFVAGLGRNGLQGKAFAMRLMHIGYTSYFVGETITPAIRASDILLVISGSGETETLLVVTNKAIDAGATIIAVTSCEKSVIGKLAEEIIVIPTSTRGSKEKTSIQMLSTVFDRSIHLVLNSLILKIVSKNNIDEKFVEKHSNLE